MLSLVAIAMLEIGGSFFNLSKVAVVPLVVLTGYFRVLRIAMMVWIGLFAISVIFFALGQGITIYEEEKSIYKKNLPFE